MIHRPPPCWDPALLAVILDGSLLRMVRAERAASRTVGVLCAAAILIVWSAVAGLAV